MEPLRYSISENAQIAFSLMHFRASAWKILAFLCAFVVAIVCLSWSTGRLPEVVPVIVGGGVGIALWLGILQFIIVPWQAKRAWNEFSLIKEPIDLTLTETGINLAQPSATLESPWQNMIAWNECAEVFAIYVTRQQAYIIPKDQVGTEHIEFARKCLIESGLSKKGKRRG